MRGKYVAALGAAALLMSAAAPASADSITIKFTRVIEPLGLSEEDQVAGQLFVIVADTDENGDTLASGQVRFSFGNDVGVQSSISEIYFDDGTLLDIAELINDDDFTAFVPGEGSPGNLPGGENLDPPFETTAGFLADAQGNPGNGVDKAGELVHIIFDLKDNQDYADVLNAIKLGGAEGGLRFGLHVRSIGENEDSASYVNIPVVPTPSAALGGLALMGLALCARRRI
jgi:hypothetical protein